MASRSVRISKIVHHKLPAAATAVFRQSFLSCCPRPRWPYLLNRPSEAARGPTAYLRDYTVYPLDPAVYLCGPTMVPSFEIRRSPAADREGKPETDTLPLNWSI